MTEKPIKIIRLPDVKHRTGFSGSQIYQLASEGKFPSPIKLSPGDKARASGWLEAEVDEYLAQRVAESRGTSLDQSRECEL